MTNESGKTTLGDAFPILGKLANQLKKAEGPAKGPPKVQPGKNKGKKSKQAKAPVARPDTKVIPTGDFSDIEAKMEREHAEAEAEEAAKQSVEEAPVEEPERPRRDTYVTPEDGDA